VTLVQDRLDRTEPAPIRAEPCNLLLQSLPAYELEQLTPLLQRVTLTPKRVLQLAGVPIQHLYFIEEGLVSVLAGADPRSSVEVWLIGREGLAGCAVLLGSEPSPLRYLVQIGGSALRIGIEDLSRILPETPELRAALKTYLHLTLAQSSQSAACTMRHSLQQRLARWMLTAQDRSTRAELPVTHELIARNLGVRRASISEAFKPMERRGIFAKKRGLITILDRTELEKIACRCYSIIRSRQEKSRSYRRPLFWLSMLGALIEVEALAH